VSLYQGRALKADPAAVRGPVARMPRPGRIVVRMLLLIAVAAITVHLPWGALRRRYAVVTGIQVEGAHYLDPSRVMAIAGLAIGADLLNLNLERARQSLLLQPRIARAEVRREWPRRLQIAIVEREPVMLVQHGVPWEVDSSGVLLAPLAEGVVADVPLLSGPDFSRTLAGTQVLTTDVRRGLAWIHALAARDLQLSGQVSEVDVSDPNSTQLLLMSGTRVLTPAWPPGTRELSALRVVLSDLQHRGTIAQVVDLRFQNQVIVRPAKPVVAEAAGLRSG
jgi:cell division septal protein FtsQ